MKRVRRTVLALVLAALAVALYALPVLAGVGTSPSGSIAGVGSSPGQTAAA